MLADFVKSNGIFDMPTDDETDFITEIKNLTAKLITTIIHFRLIYVPFFQDRCLPSYVKCDR
jgi:hypothetical protein